ncbi:MAG: UDP-2,3-diacylglucosamine diphosphatase [Bacteroidota bacterium]
MKVVFISDLHLGLQERPEDIKREDFFLRFLSRIKGPDYTLVINGDLFDYWFEYKTVIPRPFYRSLAALRETVLSGTKIEYIMGNHDFGHKDFFSEEIGIDVQKHDISREYFGKKFYISHGDGKAYNDTGYKILKKILRARCSNILFRLLHPDLGIAMASGSSQTSRHYSDKKDFGEKDGMKDFAKNKIDYEGYDYVIMGHSHKAEKVRINQGFYINLGEWINNPTLAVFEGDEVNIISVNEFIKNQ